LDARSPLRSRLRTPHIVHGIRLTIFLAVLLFPLVTPATTSAQHWAPPRTVFIPAAGQTVDGLFLDLWRAQRNMMGNPITAEFSPGRSWSESSADGQIVQYYENAALLYVPDAAPEEQVQLLPLGSEALAQALASNPSQTLTRAVERTFCGNGSPGCLSVGASGHTLRGLFLEYWESGAGALLGLPLTESFRAADNSMVQYFQNGALRLDQSGNVRPLPLGRFAANRLQLDTEPIAPPADVQVYDESLFVAPPEPEATPVEESTGWAVGAFGPGPQQGAWKEIVVSISAQAMWAYENGELVQSSYVSTGTAEVPQTVTPIGYWSVLTKYEVQDMEGTISDEYYFVEDVPHVLYFDNLGNALHGTYWHSNFGTPMSHGCVNLPLDVAAWLYDWAPIGTAVSVIA
jgi:hypothetical protein